jgi:hypothetical protein
LENLWSIGLDAFLECGENRMSRAKYIVRIVLVAAGVLLAGAKTGVASITVTDGSTQNSLTGEFQYNVYLSNSGGAEDVKAGDGFTIYDFPGLITTGPFAPTLTVPGFTFTVVQDLTGNGINALAPPSTLFGPSDVAPYTPNQLDNEVALLGADNPGIENVSIVYNGASELVGAATGVLTLYTDLGSPSATIDTDSVAASKDSSGVNSDQVYGGYVSAPVPEPIGFWVIGILGLGLCLRRTRRRLA